MSIRASVVTPIIGDGLTDNPKRPRLVDVPGVISFGYDYQLADNPDPNAVVCVWVFEDAAYDLVAADTVNYFVNWSEPYAP